MRYSKKFTSGRNLRLGNDRFWKWNWRLVEEKQASWEIFAAIFRNLRRWWWWKSLIFFLIDWLIQPALRTLSFAEIEDDADWTIVAVRWGLKISNGQMWARNYAHLTKLVVIVWIYFVGTFLVCIFFFFFYHRLKQIYTDLTIPRRKTVAFLHES